MKVIRRMHMYAGLFLSPIMLIYAISGFMLNHSHWFFGRGDVETEMPASAFTETLVESIPEPNTLANALIAKLNVRSPGEAWKLTDETRIRYNRQIGINGEGPQATVFYRFNLNDKYYTQILRPKKDDTNVGNLNILHFAEPLLAEAEKKALVKAIKKETSGMEPKIETFEFRGQPELIFSAEHDDSYWDVRYNIETGKLSARPRSSEKSISFSNMLRRMHFTSDYPREIGIRTFWAVAVDAISLLMMFWALSGILMWWQMKVVRQIGMIVFIVSIIVAATFYISMRGMFLQ